MKALSFTTLALVLLVGLFFSGCQSGPSDEQLINTTMNNWKQAFDAQDIDAIMVYYSQDFSSQEAPDKEAMRGFWLEAKRLGFLDKVNLSLEGAHLTITDDTAEFTMMSEDGNEGMAFALKKEENSTWRITADPSEITSYERYTSAYGDDCVEHASYYRCWDIYVPEGLTGNVPLVIDLHGHSEDPDHQRGISGFDALAESEGFIVVWPYGLANSWNSGPACCPPANRDELDDVGFIRKLVEKVSGQYNIDTDRIYVTGLSNGAAMAQRLANEASDIITAVACMSLHLLVPEDADYSAVSVMTILGTDDDLYEPGDTPGALANFDTWKTMNGCTGSYTQTWRSGNSVAWTYQNCDGGTEVALVTIDGGGHMLYQGAQTDIDTARLAWDFMKRFTK